MDQADPEAPTIARALDGDHLAFAELLQPHDRKLRALVYRLNGSDDLDDILQDAYLKAYRSMRTYDPERGARFGTWLWQVVHSTCIDHHRKASRQPRLAQVGQGELVGQPTIADFAAPTADVSARVVLRAQLRAALAELPPAQATVIALADGEGMSYDEIAELIDVNPGTVASRLSRARSALRELLSDPDSLTTTEGASK